MKTKIKSTLAVIVFMMTYSIAVSAQEKHDMATWAELKSFHQVMSQTFHPSEEGNLKPIMERSGELYEKALALENSKIPADFNSPEITVATKELTSRTKALDELVKNKGTDEEIKSSLASAHDSFHKIVGLCSKDDKDDHGHEGHGHDIDKVQENKK